MTVWPDCAGAKGMTADKAADFDSAIEHGAIEEGRVNRPPQQLLQILAGKVQPPAGEHRFAELETPADEVAERHANRREIAAMLFGRKLDLLARSRRIAPRDRLEHFPFDERHLARIGFG